MLVSEFETESDCVQWELYVLNDLNVLVDLRVYPRSTTGRGLFSGCS